MTTEGRAAAVQAIRDYADWLDAHPDVPVPTNVEGTVHHHGDFDESVTVCRRFADSYGATKHTSGNTGWVQLRVPGDDALPILHTIFTANKRATGDWL